jgi:hypothetical protein
MASQDLSMKILGRGKNDPWSHNQNFKAKAVTWGCSSIGRAAALQAVGQEFKPPQLHQRTGVGERNWGTEKVEAKRAGT